MSKRVDTINTQVRTKLKGKDLEAFIEEHTKTLKKRDKLDENRREVAAEFKEDLKKLDVEIKDQRLVLDLGQLVDCEVQVTTDERGRKSYKRLDTNEKIDEDQLPEQMEIPAGGEEEPEHADD